MRESGAFFVDMSVSQGINYLFGQICWHGLSLHEKRSERSEVDCRDQCAVCD